jgi:hypothetical protein
LSIDFLEFELRFVQKLITKPRMSGQQVQVVVDLEEEDDDDFAPPLPAKRRKDSASPVPPESGSPAKTTKPLTAPAASSTLAGPPLPAAMVAASDAVAPPLGLEARLAVLEKTVARLHDEKAALQKQVDGLLATKTLQDARLARLEQALASSAGTSMHTHYYYYYFIFK